MNAMIWLLFLPITPLLGWIGDLPDNVSPEREKWYARLGQWASAISHPAGAALVFLVSPLWALIWGSFAAVVVARRICASGDAPRPLPLYLRRKGRHASRRRSRHSLWTETRQVPYGRKILLVGVLAPVSQVVVGLPSILGDVQYLAAFFGPIGVMTVTIWAGQIYKRDLLDRESDRALWVSRLASAFGVGATIVGEQAGITVNADGPVVIDPLPPAMAGKITPAARDALDAAIAAVSPTHMIDWTLSNHVRLVLALVDDAIRDRRAALVASGGMLAGVVEQRADPHQTGAPHLGDLDLTGEVL